jgi:hypothetical protein
VRIIGIRRTKAGKETTKKTNRNKNEKKKR